MIVNEHCRQKKGGGWGGNTSPEKAVKYHKGPFFFFGGKEKKKRLFIDCVSWMNTQVLYEEREEKKKKHGTEGEAIAIKREGGKKHERNRRLAESRSVSTLIGVCVKKKNEFSATMHMDLFLLLVMFRHPSKMGKRGKTTSSGADVLLHSVQFVYLRRLTRSVKLEF